MSREAVYSFHRGASPLLISVPHDGRLLPAGIESGMTPPARTLPDTDWHVARLYEFSRTLGASMLVARYSRYVVDLNRSALDEALYPGSVSTGLCPTKTFAGDDIYTDPEPIAGTARERRINRFWRPYHERLEACVQSLIAQFGYALLWDAHSIASYVPRLFDGELPAFSIGTDNGRSCPAGVENAVAGVARRSAYSTVVNDRFRGGYITRHYGAPDDRCYAIQLEMSQRCYMDEATLRYDPERAAGVIETLREMLQTFIDTAATVRGAPDEKKENRNS